MKKKTSQHKKIAKARGEKWRKNMLKGRKDAQVNPSLLRLARLSRSADQIKIAEHLKVSPSTYGSIERGKRAVSKTEALKIASFLTVQKEKVFKKSGDKFVAVIRSQGL
jgi:DNA-binding XRE family transcriptional regulator